MEAGPASSLRQAAAIKSFGLKILDSARSYIGHEDKLLPPLAQATQEDRVRKGFTATDTFYRTGEMKDSYKMESWSGPNEAVAIVGSPDMKAFWAEFGRGPVRGGNPQPPRPVLGKAVTEEAERGFAVVASAVCSVFLGGRAVLAPTEQLSDMVLATSESPRAKLTEVGLFGKTGGNLSDGRSWFSK